MKVSYALGKGSSIKYYIGVKFKTQKEANAFWRDAHVNTKLLPALVWVRPGKKTGYDPKGISYRLETSKRREVHEAVGFVLAQLGEHKPEAVEVWAS